MTEIPIRTVKGPDKKSKPEEKPGFIVNGKEIKTHAELGREEYLKELLSPKLKYGWGSISAKKFRSSQMLTLYVDAKFCHFQFNPHSRFMPPT